MQTRPGVVWTVLLLALGAFAAAPPAGADEFDGSLPDEASNRAYDALTLRNVDGGNLTNVTVDHVLRIESSHRLNVSAAHVLGDLQLVGLGNVSFSNLSIAGAASIADGADVNFFQVGFTGPVHLEDAQRVHFLSVTFESCVHVDEASLGRVSFEATDPEDPVCPPEAEPSPPPSCAAANSACQTSTATKPTTNAYGDYVYELSDQRYAHDVVVRGADRVILRDSDILGDVYVSASANVLIENVNVSGSLRLEHVAGAAVWAPRVAGDLRLSSVTDFKVYGASSDKPGAVGGALLCLQCVHGRLADLRSAGPVQVKESFDVEQVNVVGDVRVENLPPAIAQETGELLLDVTDQNLTFTHNTELQDAALGVRLEMNAIQARAKLELAPPSSPGEPRLELESRFEKIVEFEDRNGDGGYDLSDLVLREYLVDDLRVSRVHQERLGDADAGWRGRIDYALPRGGTFSLIFTAMDADPDRTKIDVAFDNYAYSSKTSQLSLQVRLASASAWDIVQDAHEDRLLFHGRGVDGVFSWVHNATADGENHSIAARVLEEHKSVSGEREVVLYLAYPHAAHIFHDPSIGLQEAFGVDIPELGNLLVYGSTLVAVLAVLWALGQSTRRKPS